MLAIMSAGHTRLFALPQATESHFQPDVVVHFSMKNLAQFWVNINNTAI